MITYTMCQNSETGKLIILPNNASLARAKESLKRLNLETSESDNADTSHFQESDAVNDTPDKTKGMPLVYTN
ncbi:hypothetical protein SASPL_120594 [Salvia splendens]|uniref:Uncharacterized protein n=1 Tax=Salvia splendens TaxID=180675 RepID=A0A8X8XQT6_SALSN|nr:hypothetical protein SASPL_120594 [Salvia splendens]